MYILLRQTSVNFQTGLAGLRVGYGAFPLSIIEYLWRAKQPYNVSVAAEVSACAALKNPVYLEKVKVALVQERERLFKLLKQVPFLNPYPSYSNFILCEVTNGRDAKKLKVQLLSLLLLLVIYINLTSGLPPAPRSGFET
ncbi:putative histidinol-phosphate transaminase [Helianthus annuus]|nr:putative histidinol-phosphate transaminase [Helianthus annuus]